MKKAAKTFIVIGLVCSIILIISGFAIVITLPNTSGSTSLAVFYLIYGFYALLTNIGSLNAIKGSSKGSVIAWGISYIPVMLIASIFMFCIKEEDLI